MEIYFTNVYIDIIIKLVFASVLGSFVGLEREVHGRAAGLRTHLLVSLGAAVFMILSPIMAGISTNSIQGGDAGRIAAQIVTGIGFLGAGAIIKNGSTIRGLTTAASLWIAAAIGMSCGSGNYYIACLATIITLFALIFLPKFSRRVTKVSYKNRISFIASTVEDINKLIFDFFKNKEIHIIDFYFDINFKKHETKYTIYIERKNDTYVLPYEIQSFMNSQDIKITTISERDEKKH
ncbi:MAG: MgtC/SapB family protein [Kiritimatiellae bacterium]|jgi:putative Mg2+ transporter-C (MgtC) family protein|nr:MgtC/SapB family protein [Kiritimatiellia bacterium]